MLYHAVSCPAVCLLLAVAPVAVNDAYTLPAKPNSRGDIKLTVPEVSILTNDQVRGPYKLKCLILLSIP